jgi:Uma2 family endonuclease
MVSTKTARGAATSADLATLERCEVIAGVVEQKAAPSFEHGDAQGALVGVLNNSFRGRGGGGRPGGWWIATEVEVEFETHETYLPDIVGWRRDRVPDRPRGRPIRTRPDWVCEILSPSTAGRDQGVKHRTFHRCGVPHYWIVDPEHEILTVHRWHQDGYLVVLSAGTSDTIRAEPFDAIELHIGLLFGEQAELEAG